MKPSAWFVVLVSLPVLGGAAAVGVLVYLTGLGLQGQAPQQAIVWLCCAAGLVRIIVACFQWLGRLYILTNRRAMTLSGVIRIELFQSPLARIRRTRLSATFLERLPGLGNLHFVTGDDETASPGAWICIAQPKQVQETVEDAIRRSSAKPG
jgi:hypothetical protein